MSMSEAHNLIDDVNEDNSINENNLQNSHEEIESTLRVDEEQREKLLRLPTSRIKSIIKMDPDVNLINQEAVFLIAKSTELFIDSLTKEAYKYLGQTKKKTIQKRDVENAINNVDALVFLEGMLN